MKGFHVSDSGAIQGHHGPLVQVSNVACDKGYGLSGSVDTGVSGLAFIMEENSAIKVCKTSWVRCLMKSRVLRVIPIIRSHAPPFFTACVDFELYRDFLRTKGKGHKCTVWRM